MRTSGGGRFRSGAVKILATIAICVAYIAYPSHPAAAVNLLANSGFETGDFTGWTKADGGSGWANANDAPGAHSGSRYVISSYAWGTLSQEIDLVAAGYSAATLDAAPTISASTYVRGIDVGSGCNDWYKVKVQLRNASHGTITAYDTGQLQLSSCSWIQISHDFSGYGAGVRYVYFELDGMDSIYWAGQFGSAFDDASLTVTAPSDTTPPTISSVTSTTASGSYPAGTVIPLTVNFSEPVNSTGNVTVTLNTTPSRSCTFSVSGASSGTCNYTVQAGDTASTLNVSSISGTIADLAGNPMSNFTPASNLAASKTIVVDTTAPTITDITSSHANGTFTVGEVIPLNLTFSEPVTSTGSVTVTLNTTPTARTCTFTVTGSSTSTCNYTVQAGDSASTLNVSAVSGTLQDAATNAMTNFAPATNLAANKSIAIDAVPPTIVNVTSSAADGRYTTGAAIDIRVTFSEPVTSTGSVMVNLNTSPARSCSFTVTNSTSGTCDYSVISGDNVSGLDVSSISGSIADQVGNAMTNFAPAANLAANKSFIIYIPTPSVISLPPAISLFEPDGDETLAVGSDFLVMWSSSNVNTIRISLSTDGGLTYPTTVYEGLASGGAYSWTVPNLRTASAKLKIADTSGRASGISDGLFWIVGPVSQPAATSNPAPSVNTNQNTMLNTVPSVNPNQNSPSLEKPGTPESPSETGTAANPAGTVNPASTSTAVTAAGGNTATPPTTAQEKAAQAQEQVNRAQQDVIADRAKLADALKSGDPAAIAEATKELATSQQELAHFQASILPDPEDTGLLPPSEPFDQDLAKGSTGHKVAVLKDFLRRNGRQVSEGDVFDDSTALALAQLQAEHTHPDSLGACGLRFLNDLLRRQPGGQCKVLPLGLIPPKTAISRMLKPGDRGADVKTLQQFLNDNGFQLAGSGAGSESNETTYFGRTTRLAMARFQASFGLAAESGRLGPVNRLFLNGLVANPPLLVCPALKPPTSSLSRDLKSGDRGADVLVLQRFLNDNGYALAARAHGSKGNETTFFGPLTRFSLKRFQAAFDLLEEKYLLGPKTRAFVNALLSG